MLLGLPLSDLTGLPAPAGSQLESAPQLIRPAFEKQPLERRQDNKNVSLRNIFSVS